MLSISGLVGGPVMCIGRLGLTAREQWTTVNARVRSWTVCACPAAASFPDLAHTLPCSWEFWMRLVVRE